MIIAQIAIDQQISYMLNYMPFMMRIQVGKTVISNYWKTWTGIDESNPGSIDIISFVRGSIFKYSQLTTVNDVIGQEKSFVFDKTLNVLYVHFEHTQLIDTDSYSYGIYFGYSNKSVLYIDDIVYDPIIKNAPRVKQVQDFNGYSKLNFSNSTIELDNTSGELDQLLNLDIYGNTVKILFIDDSKIIDCIADSNDVIPICVYFIEDYTISLKSIVLNLQDMRKSLVSTVPANIFTDTTYANIDDNNIGKSIPFVYGQVREIETICTNGKVLTGNVSHRIAEFLTTLGTVQVYINNNWVTKTPNSTSLETGSFTLSGADGRDSSSGAPLRCKVVNPIGLVINYTSDIIKDLNYRFCGIDFSNSNYDMNEWAIEEKNLSTGGIAFIDKTDTYEAIRLVQSGSIIGFRYEFNQLGKRTIRIDDFNRQVRKIINNCDIKDVNDLVVKNDSSVVFAENQVSYNKSYVSGDYLSVLDQSVLSSVKVKFKQINRRQSETILNTKANAIIRAANDAAKFSDVRPILNIELIGIEYFDIRIYDIFDIEITNADVDIETNFINGRKFYGIKKCQVISVVPNDSTGTVEVDVIIIKDYDFDVLEINENGDYQVTVDGFYIIMEKN